MADGWTCDACGEPLLLHDDVRYVVRLAGHAAYDPLEITSEDLAGDLESAQAALIDAMASKTAAELENDVHREFAFDLCRRCWLRWTDDPLRGLRGPPAAEGPRS